MALYKQSIKTNKNNVLQWLLLMSAYIIWNLQSSYPKTFKSAYKQDEATPGVLRIGEGYLGSWDARIAPTETVWNTSLSYVHFSVIWG